MTASRDNKILSEPHVTRARLYCSRTIDSKANIYQRNSFSKKIIHFQISSEMCLYSYIWCVHCSLSESIRLNGLNHRPHYNHWSSITNSIWIDNSNQSIHTCCIGISHLHRLEKKWITAFLYSFLGFQLWDDSEPQSNLAVRRWIMQMKSDAYQWTRLPRTKANIPWKPLLMYFHQKKCRPFDFQRLQMHWHGRPVQSIKFATSS